MRILGVDPGLAIVGFGLIQSQGTRLSMVEYGTIQTDANTPMPQRLIEIFDGISRLVERVKPDAIAVEELFFNTNVTTAIAVAQARGAILVAAGQQAMLYEYTPLQVKQALSGYGRADKQQVQQMVKTLLKLSEIPKPDDAADGLALAICHAFTGGARHQFKIK